MHGAQIGGVIVELDGDSARAKYVVNTIEYSVWGPAPQGARFGDQVPVYYLPSQPSESRIGDPRPVLQGEYQFLFLVNVLLLPAALIVLGRYVLPAMTAAPAVADAGVEWRALAVHFTADQAPEGDRFEDQPVKFSGQREPAPATAVVSPDGLFLTGSVLQPPLFIPWRAVAALDRYHALLSVAGSLRINLIDGVVRLELPEAVVQACERYLSGKIVYPD